MERRRVPIVHGFKMWAPDNRKYAATPLPVTLHLRHVEVFSWVLRRRPRGFTLRVAAARTNVSQVGWFVCSGCNTCDTGVQRDVPLPLEQENMHCDDREQDSNLHHSVMSVQVAQPRRASNSTNLQYPPSSRVLGEGKRF